MYTRLHRMRHSYTPRETLNLKLHRFNPYTPHQHSQAPRKKEQERTSFRLSRLFQDPLDMPLKQLHIRSQTRLLPPRLRVPNVRRLFQLHQQLPDGRDEVGVEALGVGGEEGDADAACFCAS